VGRKPVLAIVSYLSALAPLAVLFFFGSTSVLAVLQLPMYLCLGIAPLFMGIIPAETVPARQATTAMGLVICTGEVIGGFVVPTTAGWIADQTSLAAPIWMAAIAVGLGGSFALMLKETAPAKVKRQGQAASDGHRVEA
jgi:F0F1-type ATP synthase assembly protein I